MISKCPRASEDRKVVDTPHYSKLNGEETTRYVSLDFTRAVRFALVVSGQRCVVLTASRRVPPPHAVTKK